LTDLTQAVAPDEKPYPSDVEPDEIVQQFFENFSIYRRQHDAALLFLVEPLHVLTDERAVVVVADIEQHLQRHIGIARYKGDTYWEPDFKQKMDVSERTWAAPGRTESRNITAAGIAYSGKEAQWTLFDSLLSTYWGKQYMASGNPIHRQKQLSYLDRSLKQLHPTDEGLRLPEAYYYEPDESYEWHWVPNDHMPLLWSQANLLTALKVFEETSP
jgi:phosphorylase kinase alpha/beta subunit